MKFLSGCIALFMAGLACQFISPPPPPPTPIEHFELASPPAETGLPPTATAEPTEMPSALPDLLRIVYGLAGDRIYLWEPGQLAARPVGDFASEGFLKLSDDGRLVAYSQVIDQFFAEIWVLDLESEQARRLMSPQDFEAYYPQGFNGQPAHVMLSQFEWIPGTHTLAISLRAVAEEGPGVLLYDDLHYLDADSGERKTVFEAGEGGAFVFSPDGLLMALSSPTSIGLANADGSELRWDLIRFEEILTYSEYQLYPRPVWGRDSSRFMVAIPPRESLADPTPPTAIWDVPVDGGAAQKMVEFIPAPLFAFAGVEIIAPDLSRFAYERPFGDPGENLRELVLAVVDGSADEVYDSGPVLFTGWSPDSVHFTYSLISEPGASLVGRVGGPVTQIGSSGFVQQVKWIDGDSLLYVEFLNDAWQLQAQDLGSAAIVLARAGSFPPVFDFSPRP